MCFDYARTPNCYARIGGDLSGEATPTRLVSRIVSDCVRDYCTLEKHINDLTNTAVELSAEFSAAIALAIVHKPENEVHKTKTRAKGHHISPPLNAYRSSHPQ